MVTGGNGMHAFPYMFQNHNVSTTEGSKHTLSSYIVKNTINAIRVSFIVQPNKLWGKKVSSRQKSVTVIFLCSFPHDIMAQ